MMWYRAFLFSPFCVIVVLGFDGNLKVFSTDGESGGVCTKKKERCVAEAECIDKKCVCPVGTKGDGRVFCAPEEDEVCLVTDDYRITGFGGYRANVRFPCSMRLAKFCVFTDVGWGRFTCGVDVFSSAHFAHGTYYPRAVHIHVFVMKHYTWREQMFNFVLMASVDGNFTFQFESYSDVDLEMSEDGKTGTYEWHNIHVNCTHDTENNFVIVDVPECGATVRFRPADLDLLQNSTTKVTLPFVPAIVIQAPAHTKWGWFWPYGEHSLCGKPSDPLKFWKILKKKMKLNNKLQAVQRFAIFTHSQFDHDTVTSFESPVCSGPPVRYCERQTLAVRACGAVLYNGPLIQCLQSQVFPPGASLAYHLQRLFTFCFRFVCGGRYEDCLQLKEILREDDACQEWLFPSLDDCAW